MLLLLALLAIASTETASVAGVAVSESAFITDIDSDAANDTAPAAPAVYARFNVEQNSACRLLLVVGVCCYLFYC